VALEWILDFSRDKSFEQSRGDDLTLEHRALNFHANTLPKRNNKGTKGLNAGQTEREKSSMG
jgi:hypothetical protein